MDQYTKIYNQIINNKCQTNKNYIDLVQHLKQVISNHLEYFVNREIYERYKMLLRFKYSNLDIDKSYQQMKEQIRSLFTIQCDDPIKLKFRVINIDTKDQTKFVIIPDYLKQLIKQAYEFIVNGGTISNPSEDNYYVYIKPIKYNKKFKKIRKDNIANIQKQKQNQVVNIFKYSREESINDVFLQYVSYFRNK